jgi:predicted Holliday junction resolvase-like endonuclease
MNETEGALLQAVIQVIVAVAVPLLTALVSLWLNQKIQQVKGQMSAQQLAMAESVISSMVKAAEQVDLAGAAKLAGWEKKMWVASRVQAWLDETGIKLDALKLTDLIEAAVLEELNKGKLPSGPAEK